jgi:hypothetical protein
LIGDDSRMGAKLRCKHRHQHGEREQRSAAGHGIHRASAKCRQTGESDLPIHRSESTAACPAIPDGICTAADDCGILGAPELIQRSAAERALNNHGLDSMPYVIGTDEAGYGPNLGPLCVGATVWEIDDGIDPQALYKPLKRCVTSSVDRAGKNRVVWADSKTVYKNGCGMDHVERGVLTALSLAGHAPTGWSDLWNCLGATSADESNQQPWHDGYSARLPLWMDEEDGADWMSGEAITEFSNGLKVQLAESGVRLVGVLCRAVFASTFNEMVAASNKADTLSRITLGLVADAMAMISSQRIQVFCDKHGGRDYYLPLLQNQFSDDWIEVRQESGQASTYRFGGESSRVDIGFYVGGERFLPIALASMTAKYLRETAMRPFNEFWLRHVPGIKPTAGYPTDSRRFKKQIAEAQRELAIEDRILWRER